MPHHPHTPRTSRLAAGVLAAASLAAALAPAAQAAPRARDLIAQFGPASTAASRAAAIQAAGGRVTRDVELIHAAGVRISPDGARRLARVAHLSPNAAVRTSAAATKGYNPAALATSYVQSSRADRAWSLTGINATGTGVGVAVLDTGIAGGLADFRTSQTDATSRVVASAVVNPRATTAGDAYGHGTHVAGIIAGNSRNLPSTDAQYNKYIGTAPEAKLVSIKVADDDGNSTVLDVIEGLQFAVDHKADYNIRVANLSLDSAAAESYRTDPLDAAVEAAWNRGIVVVVAAGNRGTAADGVSYAPANDPYVITVGGVDDQATQITTDDTMAGWTSRGRTQDGLAKPDVFAPGAHIVSTLAPGSAFARLCPSCVTGGGRYFRISGTSMAAPVVAGIAAGVLSAHPTWTPNQVKGAITNTANMRWTKDGQWEVAADWAANPSTSTLVSNQGLVPNQAVDPSTGDIDYTRASWSKASWSTAADALKASWSKASWSCTTCTDTLATATDPTKASWSKASWSAFFGDLPSTYGEISGGTTGAAG